MKPHFFTSCLLAATLSLPLQAADEAKTNSEPKQASKEEIQARLEEHAHRKAMGTAAAEAADSQEKAAPKSDTGAPVAPAAVSAAAEAKQEAAKAATPAAEEKPTVLPKLEVQKGKITELDRQVAKQNREIAREKQNTKPTKLDETLNGPGISKALAIFGGQSSEDRANIAAERVAMMEDERDLIEAIAQAQTKEEKDELQKTLDAIRAMRRDLEESLR
jgi:hypothetical protein